jgi:hypothetical protein
VTRCINKKLSQKNRIFAQKTCLLPINSFRCILSQKRPVFLQSMQNSAFFKTCNSHYVIFQKSLVKNLKDRDLRAWPTFPWSSFETAENINKPKTASPPSTHSEMYRKKCIVLGSTGHKHVNYPPLAVWKSIICIQYSQASANVSLS